MLALRLEYMEDLGRLKRRKKEYLSDLQVAACHHNQLFAPVVAAV